MQRVQPVLGRSADAFTACIDAAIRLSGRLFFHFAFPFSAGNRSKSPYSIRVLSLLIILIICFENSP